MKLKLYGLNEIQSLGVTEVLPLLGAELADGGISIHFFESEKDIHIQFDGNSGIIQYHYDSQLYRALGLVVEGIKKDKPFETKESPIYDSLSVMIDCSRNAVLRMEAYQELIRRLALMGYTTIQLYTEDTYEIKNYPYFGYMRGRYSGEEMKMMDEYAKMFGIELVPCIQTLAHLGTALRWNAFSDIVDCNDILLIDEEKTYQLIDSMFLTMSENISSRKINIGMDEAHMMGLGKYLDKHGYEDRSSLMLKHFNRVMEIARKYDYQPMMWSDMFFRLASGGDYLDINSPIRQDVIDLIPDDISLVYWDYYSDETEKYDGMLRKHKQLSDQIIFAGGAWKWMGFSPNNQFSNYVGEMAHESCVNNGIKEVLVTTWGDNGAEGSIFTILPNLQLWAELCYTNSADKDRLSERFNTCVGGNFDDFMMLDATMLVPDKLVPNTHSINPPKYLMYQDILCGLFDKHIIPNVYEEHFRKSAETLEQCIVRNPEWKTIFQTQYSLSRLLEIKSDAGINIRSAYLNNNRDILVEYEQDLLPELRKRIEQFIVDYQAQWIEENKIFGRDVFDIRMGGLLQRVEVARSRLFDYLSGKVSNLEELEQEILYFDGREHEADQKAISANLWHTIVTPSVIAGV